MHCAGYDHPQAGALLAIYPVLPFVWHHPCGDRFLTKVLDLQTPASVEARDLIARFLGARICTQIANLRVHQNHGMSFNFRAMSCIETTVRANRSWQVPMSWHAADASAREMGGPAAHKSVWLSTRTGPSDVIWTGGKSQFAKIPFIRTWRLDSILPTPLVVGHPNRCPDMMGCQTKTRSNGAASCSKTGGLSQM